MSNPVITKYIARFSPYPYASAQVDLIRRFDDLITPDWDVFINEVRSGSRIVTLRLLDRAIHVRITGKGVVSEVRWDRTGTSDRHPGQTMILESQTLLPSHPEDWRRSELTFGDPTPPKKKDIADYVVKWVQVTADSVAPIDVLRTKVEAAERERDRRRSEVARYEEQLIDARHDLERAQVEVVQLSAELSMLERDSS